MNKIAFAGTFDPVTNGHLWVIKEALNFADKVLVIVAVNSTKSPLFSEEIRKTMMEESIKQIKGNERIEVMILKQEYVAQFASLNGCEYMIRGIRSAGEFDYEALVQKTNTDVLYGAKTLFVMPPRDLQSVSSSFIKSLVGPIGWHWYIKNFVSEYVYNYWVEMYIKDICIKFCKDERILNLIDFAKPYYNQPQRHYHNFSHLAHCLQELAWLTDHYQINKIDVKHLFIAILGHDIIYGAKDAKLSDEELSAQLIYDWSIKNNLLQKEESLRVRSMIQKTQYLADITLDNDIEKIMCSIDLAILGQPKQVYEIYSNNIRQEYEQVADLQYINGRLSALEKISKISPLYQATQFSHYEARAKLNLLNEIERIKRKT